MAQNERHKNPTSEEVGRWNTKFGLAAIGVVGEGRGVGTSGTRDVEVLAGDDFTTANANEDAIGSEKRAFEDASVGGDIRGPSSTNGGNGHASGLVDTDKVASGLTTDEVNDTIAIDMEIEVELRSALGEATNVGIDTFGLVVEHEEVVVDTNEQDGGIEVGVGKGFRTSQGLDLLILDDVDGGTFVHNDEVDGHRFAVAVNQGSVETSGAEGVATLREFLETAVETSGRNDDEIDTFVVHDTERHLVVNLAFDVETTIEFRGGTESVEVRSGDERDAVVFGNLVVIEPLERGVHARERILRKGVARDAVDILTLDDVAQLVGFDEGDDLREAVGIDFGDDLRAVDLGGGGRDGKTVGLFVVHHLDDVLGGAVHLEFAGLPLKGGSGLLIATLVRVIGETFRRASLDVVALVVGETAISDFRDFDNFRVVEGELNLAIGVREKGRTRFGFVDLIPRFGGVFGNQFDAVC